MRQGQVRTIDSNTRGLKRTAGVRVARVLSQVRTDLPLRLLDAMLAVGAYFSLLVARFDGTVPTSHWHRFAAFIPVAVVLHLGSNWAWGLYGQIWRHAGVAEARRVVLAGTTAAFAGFAYVLIARPTVPASVVIFGALTATVLSGFVRFQTRLFAFTRTNERRFGLRVAVVGAGQSGAAAVREMQRDPHIGLVPVVVVDDDPRTHHRLLLGVPIVGSVEDLADQIAECEAQQVLLAVPSADQELLRRVATVAEQAGVPLKVLPNMKEIFGGEVSVRAARSASIEDLLGRQQVDTDLDAVRAVIEGRSVLITGAGGSIGSEIARQVAECNPVHLILVDHDETHLHDAAALLDGPCEQVLADIRDRELVHDVFARFLPEIVFHAAAHKHVPLLESHPCEAVETNVLGTVNVVDAAARFGVQHLVFISTDKAVRPSSIMGASKMMGEQIVLSHAPTGARYCAVRFGNVLGSRGSVIPTFRRQIDAGGPVTVTDPRMTRFFMSVREAVQLVLQAAVFAEGGEVFMLEMGEPVNIYELAKRMIRMSGYSVGTEIPIRITGVRPGEKLVEELRAPGEELQTTGHPSIARLHPTRLDTDVLEQALRTLREMSRRRQDVALAEVLVRLAVDGTARRDVIDLVALEQDPSCSLPIT